MKAYKGGKFSKEENDVDANLLKVIKKHEKPGRNVVVNESENKFSEMLLELVKPHFGKFSQLENLEEILKIAVLAWNIGSMKKVMPQMYKIMLDESTAQLENDGGDVQLLEKMIKEKLKKFPEQDMFIHDFEIDLSDDGQLFIAATAKPLEAFLNETVMEDDDDDDYDFDFEAGFINRNAITIKVRQPFIDWTQKLGDNTLFRPQIEDDNVYLLEEKESNKDFESWLRKNFDKIFKLELSVWSDDKKSWPANRSYKMFREWFDVAFNSLVYDLENFPISKD